MYFFYLNKRVKVSESQVQRCGHEGGKDTQFLLKTAFND